MRYGSVGVLTHNTEQKCFRKEKDWGAEIKAFKRKTKQRVYRHKYHQVRSNFMLKYFNVK